MWRTKHLLFSILLSIFILYSCSNTEPEISTNTVTAQSPAIPTTIPESTPTLKPLPTETLTATTPLPPIKTQCAGDSKDNQKLDLSGVIALNKVATLESSEFGFRLINLKNGNIIRDVKEGLLTQVSPDQKHIGYKYIKDDKGFLSILDSKGKTIIDLESRFDGQRMDYFNWQNSEQLRILHQGNQNTLLAQLFNPFSQEYAPLRTDWDEVYTPKNPYKDKLVYWQFDAFATEFRNVYGANILYDPSLTRVLYPKDKGVVSLIDVQNNIELTSAQFEDWGKLPSWSPDGKYLSIVGHQGNADDFYLISRDGNEFQRITDFSGELEFASISGAVWSPESKQIAFWLNTEPAEQKSGTQSELAILDVASRQVTRLCIQGISNGTVKPWVMGHAKPIWSPDGKYVIITRWDDPNSPKNYYVLAVDTQTGNIDNISKNTEPIGWMSSE